MASYSSHPGKRPASPPEVERPHSRIWQELEAESIRWDGQVLIVGEVQDLPARLVLTRQRLALIANRSIALEMPREWLRPAPELTAENGIRLFIDPDSSGKPESMMLRAREGRGAAAELVAIIAGRPLPVENAPTQVRIPNWKEKVGAAPPMALPPLTDDEDTRTADSRAAAWPPQEIEGIAHQPKAHPHQPRTPIDRPQRDTAVTARAGSNVPVPTPVPSSISRAAQKQGTQADGFTVAETSIAAPAVIPDQQQSHSRGRHAAAWVFRAAIVLMLVGTIGYFGRDRIALTYDDVRSRIPADVQDRLGIADDTSDVAINTAPDNADVSTEGGQDQAGDGTEGPAPDDSDEASVDEPTEAVRRGGDSTLNIGGNTTEIPPTTENDVIPVDPTAEQAAETETAVPTEVPEPTAVPTEEPTVVPTEEPTAVPTEEPTAVPTEEPTAVPTEVPTEAPTEEPTAVPTEEPTTVPTEEPTALPTEEPTEVATEEPTTAPTEAPAQVAAEEPIEEPVEEPAETPEPALEPQAPSVEPETTPEQAIVSEGFRYTIEGVARGDTIPELPEINSVGTYGEWVVISVYGQNMTDSAQVFDMRGFRLYADGQEVLVDVGNAWVSGLAGNSPAYGNTDAIQWAPGEGHRFILTFLVPPEAGSLILQAGDQTIDLAPALEDPAPLLGAGEPPTEPDLLQGTVVEVIDAETIVVEIDGIQQTVRYLGVNVPKGDDCYAAEALKANSNLVAGETVMIERQATHVDARGNWVRDVWVTNEEGYPVLVSQQLIEQGAAEGDISVPNTRFAGWFEAAQSSAQAEDAGIWGACEQGTSTETESLLGIVDRRHI